MSLSNLQKHEQGYNNNSANWDDMNQFLSQYNFTLALNSNNAEFIWLYFKADLNSALNLYDPEFLSKNQINPGGSTLKFYTKSNTFVPLQDN